MAALEPLLQGVDDPLAMVYENLVKGENRRHLGTFFTPQPIVDHMAKTVTSLSGAPESVVDPGAGVGAFTLTAIEEWPDAVVHSIDVNAVTLGLLAARCAQPERLSLHPCDYVSWAAQTLPTLAQTVVLGNPPYTRHQLMSQDEKTRLLKASAPLVSSGLAGLSAYFLAVTLRHLPADGTLAFLLPATWNEANYGAPLREWLWAQHRRSVDLQFFPSDTTVFPGTQVTAMMLFVGPVEVSNRSFALRGATVGATNKVSIVRADEYPDRRGTPPDRWTAPQTHPVCRTTERTVALEVAVRLRRGAATGANHFFFLTDDERERWSLGEDSLRRAVVKAAHLDTDFIDVAAHDRLRKAGRRGWLLRAEREDVERSAELSAYIAWGEEQGLHRRYLTGIRDCWFDVEEVPAAQILLAPVGHQKHTVLLNEAQVLHSNSLYGMTPRDGLWQTAATIATWLRAEDGQDALKSISRRYSGGSLKIEPKALRRLPIPARLVPSELQGKLLDL